MTKNMGTADRVARAGGAVAVLALYSSGQITGTAATVLGLLAVAFALTSLVGWCPAYAPLGFSTRRSES